MSDEIKVTVQGLRPLMTMMYLAPELVTQEITRAMRQSTLTIEGEAKHRVPVKTGTLRRSIHSEVRPISRGVEGLVGTITQYAPYVEFGTGIYGPQKRPIVPRTKKALAWKSEGGEMIIRRSVRGMRPRPYLKPAFDAKLREVEGFFRAALKRVLGRLAHGR